MDHISYSQLNMVLKCGEQYRRRYVKGDIIPPSGTLVRGKCGHRALELNLKQKIETDTDLPTEAVLDEFTDNWEKEKYSIAYGEEELEGRSPKVIEGQLKDSGVGMVRVFHEGDPARKVEAISPRIHPLEVEQEFLVEFEETPVKLKGVIDTVDRDHVISDRKFTGKTPSDADALHDDQLSIYDLGHRVKYGTPATRLEKHCAIDLKSGPKTKIVVSPPREEDQLHRILSRLQAGMNAIKSGTFVPAPSGVWWCSPKWCGYWPTCKLHP